MNSKYSIPIPTVPPFTINLITEKLSNIISNNLALNALHVSLLVFILLEKIFKLCLRIKETRISLTVDTARSEIQEVTDSFLNGFIRFILNHKIRKAHRVNINFLTINNCKMVVHNLIVSHTLSPLKFIKL